MSRRLKHDLLGPDWRVTREDVLAKGWEALFSGCDRPLRLHVEFGFGGGEFLQHLARRDPGAAHLGIEVSAKRVFKLARRLARSEIGNIRLLESTAEAVLGDLLDLQTVQGFWINFPDPWPKRRHHPRRMITPDFVHEISRRLAPGRLLEVATDHVAYGEVIDTALSAEPLLENALAPAPFLPELEDRVSTAYELTWRAEGRPLRFWQYRRCVDTSESAS